MSENRASEIIQEVINQLVREKSSLNTRLRTLNREHLPGINTRTQRLRLIQIEGTRIRLTEIDQELERQRYKLSRARNQPIDDFSESLNNLRVSDNRRSNRFASLENFINRSREMADETPEGFRRQPRIERTPVVTTSEAVIEEESEAQVAQATLPGAETSVTAATSTVPTAQIEDDNMTSSTPRSNIRPTTLNIPESEQSNIEVPPSTGGLTITSEARTIIPLRSLGGYMRSNLGGYDFPPNYESADDRAFRLEQERHER